MRKLFGCLVLSCLIIGCQGDSFTVVPVSGTVKLNGKVLENAYVELQPVGGDLNSKPGPGSVGKTDKQGRFTLTLTDGSDRKGAVVGKHVVRIALDEPGKGDSSLDADSGAKTQPKKGSNAITIPSRYNDDSKETVEIPAGGKDDLLFDLKSP
jgi:hypothetical protein